MIAFTHLPHWVDLDKELKQAQSFGAPDYADSNGLNANVVRSSFEAQALVRESMLALPSLETMRMAHTAMFLESAPKMAGAFREDAFSYPATSFKPEKTTCPPSEIPEKLEQLSHKAIAAMGQGDDDRTRLNAIAAWHAGFMEIHPFKDGNGRFARTVLSAQLEHCFGPKQLKPIDPVQYKQALSSGLEGNWKPLAGLIENMHERALKPEQNQSRPQSVEISI